MTGRASRGRSVPPFHERANRRSAPCRGSSHRCRSQMSQNRSRCTWSGAPSYIITVAPCRQRSVHNVRVSRHPADIRGAPEDIVIAKIEDVASRRHRLGQIATGGMNDSLRLSGCARRVKDEEQVFCHSIRSGSHTRRLGVERAVPPVIAPLGHRRLRGIDSAAAMDDEAAPDRRTILRALHPQSA